MKEPLSSSPTLFFEESRYFLKLTHFYLITPNVAGPLPSGEKGPMKLPLPVGQ